MAQSINETGLYALEFEQQGTQEIVSLRYWKADQLVKIQLCRHSTSSYPSRNQLLAVARLMSFFLTSPQRVCMSGCTSEVLQAVQPSTLLKKGIEHPFGYEVLYLHKLMHKREGSVFGRIDIYTQLRYLVVYLSGSLDEPWIVRTPELAKVSFVDRDCCLFALYKLVQRFVVSRQYPVVTSGSGPSRPSVPRSLLTGNHFLTISPRLHLPMRCKELETRLHNCSL